MAQSYLSPARANISERPLSTSTEAATAGGLICVTEPVATGVQAEPHDLEDGDGARQHHLDRGRRRGGGPRLLRAGPHRTVAGAAGPAHGRERYRAAATLRRRPGPARG